MSKSKTPKKKILGILTSLAVILCMMPSMAFATGTDVTFSGGSGTAENPYRISNVGDLNDMAKGIEQGNNYANKHFVLTEDIPKDDSWKGARNPDMRIGSNDSKSPTVSGVGFAGTFDGNDKKITIGFDAGENSVTGGLFAYVEPTGVVKDVTIAGSFTASGSDAAGGVVGYNKGTLDNVINEAKVTAEPTYNVGGVAGFNEGYILNSDNKGAVAGSTKVGGINGENAGTINSCSNTATINGLDYSKNGVGGIVGRNGNNNTAVETGNVYNCWNSGAIRCKSASDSGKWVGGICGFQNSLSKSVNCYNIGTMEAKDTKDHIAGKNEGAVENCYGRADGNGYNSGAEYYDGAIIKTESDMKSDSFLTELSVGASDEWAQTPGQYPYLTKTAEAGDDDPSAATYTVSMASAPVRTVYQVGETFDVSGMVVRVTYTNSSQPTQDINTGFTVSNTSELTTSDKEVTVSCEFDNKTYSYKIPITVVVPVEYYLDPIDGKDSNDGKSGQKPVKTFDKAIELATANKAVGNTIYIMNTVEFTEAKTTQDNVIFKSASNLSGTMFNVNAGSGNTVRMTTMTAMGSGTIITVSSGTLNLRGGAAVISDDGAAINLEGSGSAEINKATVRGAGNSLKISGGDNTFNLTDYTGTTLSGKLYLGTGAYITVGAKIPCNIDVEMETTSGNPTVARGTDSYLLTDADQSKVTVAGHTVVIDPVGNELYLQ